MDLGREHASVDAGRRRHLEHPARLGQAPTDLELTRQPLRRAQRQVERRREQQARLDRRQGLDNGAIACGRPIHEEEGARAHRTVVAPDLHPDIPLGLPQPAADPGLLDPLCKLRVAGVHVRQPGSGVRDEPMLYSYLLDPTYSSHQLADVALRRFNLRQQEFVFYVHPWEVDPGQPRIRAANALSRFRHYLNLDRCARRFLEYMAAL